MKSKLSSKFNFVIVIICISTLFTVSCKKEAPEVHTIDSVDITSTSFSAGINLVSEGDAPCITMGVVWGTGAPTLENCLGFKTETPDIGITRVSVTGLTRNTQYKIRAFAENKYGTSYGETITTSTPPMPPEVTTLPMSQYTGTTVKLGCNVTEDGGSQVTENGIYYGTSANPETTGTKVVISSGIGSFTTVLTGINAGSTYYVRAYAKSGYGQVLGSTITINSALFTTGKLFNSNLTYGNVTDIDGNNYKTIVIGTQTWFAENLRTTKYNDGTAVPLVTDASLWMALTTPAYCSYENNSSNDYFMGAIYNWYVTQTGKICPTGWHVPSDAEWTTLTDYLGGESVAGGPMKETGTTHWNSPNTGATNSSGFTALPGGKRKFQDGTFTGIGVFDIWLSSSELTAGKPYYRSSSTNNTTIYSGSGGTRQEGNTIRCVKN